MSAIEFPYSRYKDHKLPIVPIEILSGKKWYEIWVFVDSGATYSILNYKESKRMSIDPKDGEKVNVKVGSSMTPLMSRGVARAEE